MSYHSSISRQLWVPRQHLALQSCSIQFQGFHVIFPLIRGPQGGTNATLTIWTVKPWRTWWACIHTTTRGGATTCTGNETCSSTAEDLCCLELRSGLDGLFILFGQGAVPKHPAVMETEQKGQSDALSIAMYQILSVCSPELKGALC